MEAELESIARRDKISGILQTLDGSDSEVEELLAEEAMEELEAEDLQAEQDWIHKVEEKRRRRKTAVMQAAQAQESKRIHDKTEERRRAMAAEVDPPWLEGPT